MNNLSLIDFQIFPSLYEENSDGEKCCWLGGRDSSDGSGIALSPYQTDAIAPYTNPEWGFHLLATTTADQYRLKYVKMSEPDKEWYGVSVDNGKIVLKKWKEDTHFIVKKLGAYYTMEYNGQHVECENGKLGDTTTIQFARIAPPTQQELGQFDTIPDLSFRILWKFVKMEYIDGRDWITKLANTRSGDQIHKLFIPGTHDSGTSKNTQWLQTQWHTIPEQAAMGVRYFDLRVADDFKIYHNSSNSGIWLDYVVNSIVTHMTEHPNEFFFIQITPETANGFSTKLFNYLKQYCPTVFPYVATANYTDMPTLGNAQGKIFFFARYYAPVSHNDSAHPFKEYRFDWQDDINGGYANHDPFGTTHKAYVQDHYNNISNDDKVKAIKPVLNLMFPGNSADWIINFTSVSNSNYPIHDAYKINPQVANLLMWTNGRPSGVLMIDEARVGSIANIMALNFG